MARELEVQITVEQLQAKRALQDIDRELKTLTKDFQSSGMTMDDYLAKHRALSVQLEQAQRRTAELTVAKQDLTGSVRSLTSVQNMLTSAIVDFAGPVVIGIAIKRALDYADQLTKLSDKTGIGVEALQRMGYAATQSGNTLEQVTNAVSIMQKRIAGDDKSAVAALAALNLTLDDFKGKTPDQQFRMLAEAVALVPDPMQQTKLATDLMGRSAAEVLPTLKALAKGMGDDLTVATQQTIDTLDAAGDGWDAFTNRMDIAIQNVTALAIESYQTLSTLFALSHGLTLGTNPGNTPTVGSPSLFTAGPELGPAGASFNPLALLNDQLERNTKLLKDNAKAAAEAAKDRAAWLKTVAFGPFLLESGLPTSEAGNVPGQLSRGYMGGLQHAGASLGSTLGSETIGNGFLGPITGGKGLSSGGGFLSSLLAGPKGLLQGLTGGNGISGLFSNIGSGLLTGGLSTIISGASKLIGGLFGKLFNNPEKQINPIREAFVQAAGGLGTLNEKAHEAGVTLTALLNAKNPEAYKKAIDELTAAFKFQDDAMKVLDDTVQKYGFTIDELGPAFARQKLDDKAKELYQDFKVLTSAGIDIDTVLGKMGDSVNQFVQMAVKTGTEVPEAMRPMIQRMIELGLLTDENGNVFASLEDAGVQFALSMSEGFRGVIDEVKKLTDAISRGLGLAIENVPPLEITTVYKKSLGIPTEEAGVVPMASGGIGRALRPTLFYTKGNEDFAFSGEGKRFGGGTSPDLIAEVRNLGEAIQRGLYRAVRDGMVG